MTNRRMRAMVSLVAIGTITSAVLWNVAPQSASAVPIAHAAAVDYFLKLDGVDGDSKDPAHKGEIEVASWSFGASNPTSVGSGGGGAGKVNFHDMHLKTDMSKASPTLLLRTADGKHLLNGILIGLNQKGEKFLEIKLSDVLVSSYESTGDQGGRPADEFSLNFSKIEFSYISKDGSVSKATWDIKENKGV